MKRTLVPEGSAPSSSMLASTLLAALATVGASSAAPEMMISKEKKYASPARWTKKRGRSSHMTHFQETVHPSEGMAESLAESRTKVFVP